MSFTFVRQNSTVRSTVGIDSTTEPSHNRDAETFECNVFIYIASTVSTPSIGERKVKRQTEREREREREKERKREKEIGILISFVFSHPGTLGISRNGL